MTIYSTLISRGYFPKELPPSFFTEVFAHYATTKGGRAALESYVPTDKFTECVAYRLALPGALRRDLGIPHPSSFSELARLTAKYFRRLLKKAGRSPFSKSRPVFSSGVHRAFGTSFKPSNLARERFLARAGGSYLVKADVSHFYPSLYTHAVGWAIDPQLRQKAHWQNKNLLGKKLDQALMNLQGKVSQGLPIGNDISYLLAEVVLADVDRALRVPASRAYRWFDDYEVSCDSLHDAELVLSHLRASLGRFRLRLNAKKTSISPLPRPAQEEWQKELVQASRTPLNRHDNVVAFFDTAFRLRERHPETAVLTYALGLLFRIRVPEPQVVKVAHSGVSQALLAEPGVAQKAFSLLSFWHLNGLPLDQKLLTRTVANLVERHRAIGVTSDVSWALAFSLQHQLKLSREAGRILSGCDDDCVALQALHCNSVGLIPQGFTPKRMERLLKTVNLDGEHWLLGYEALRQGFLAASSAVVQAHPLFSHFLKLGVTFYRTKLPSYSSVIHPGGAPEWMVSLWFDILGGRDVPVPQAESARELAVFQVIAGDVQQLAAADRSREETIAALLKAPDPGIAELLADAEEYAGVAAHFGQADER